MNPFRLPKSAYNTGFTPLNPLKWSEHEKYYAPVDNTAKAFDEYKEFLENLQSGPFTHAVLFHGESGCGKTSLMNRCASVIKNISWKFSETKYSLFLIDARELDISAKSAEQKINTIMQLIVSALEEDKDVSEKLVSDFKEKIKIGSEIALNYLASQTEKLGLFLLILFPNADTKEDIKQYVNSFYQNNWMLFLETENHDAIKYCKRINGKLIKCLGVNPLIKPEDGDEFIAARLSKLEENDIIFDEVAIRDYILSARKRGGASIREIETVCEKAYGDAQSNENNLIKFTDIAKIAISKFNVGKGDAYE